MERKIQAQEVGQTDQSNLAAAGEAQQVAENSSYVQVEDGASGSGQYLNAYLVVTAEEGLMIVDQHNAHERILFEKFKQLDEEKGWASRQMLSLRFWSQARRRVPHLEELQEELAGLGFELESLGERSYSLRAFPDVFDERRATEILRNSGRGRARAAQKQTR